MLRIYSVVALFVSVLTCCQGATLRKAEAATDQRESQTAAFASQTQVLNMKESHSYIPQTWGFLRDSAAHVGDVAQEVLNVQNNLEIMKADVEQGAMHWKKIQ